MQHNVEGPLYKWTNYAMGWKSRYFVLRGSIMYYYLSKGEKVRGKIHLNVAEIIPLEHNPLNFQIDTGTTMVYLCADDGIDKKMWVDALLLVKKKEEEMMDAKPAPVTIKKAPEFISNESDDRLLKKIITTKNFLENFTKNNNELGEMIKRNELTQTSLSGVLNSYKNDLHSINSSVDEVAIVLNKFFGDFNKFKDYLEGAHPVNHSLKHNERNSRQYDKPDKYEKPVLMEPEIKKKLSDNKIQVINDNINDYFYGIEEYSLTPTPDLEYNQKKSQNISPISKPHNPESFINNTLDHHQISLKMDLSDHAKPNPISIPKSNKSDGLISSADLKIPKSKFYNENYVNKRTKLPFDRKVIKFNIWTILKDAIGKDLNRFTMPVYLNEPLSMLQRFAEPFQYARLLNRASKDQNPHIRLALCAAFCTSGFAFSKDRTLKFFNPVLGETYELVDNEIGFRYFGEQVSHHPAISAMFSEGDGWELYANTNAKSKFDLIANCLEFAPIGRTHIKFSDFNEQISYSKPAAVVRNIVYGDMHLDVEGKSEIINHTNGDSIELIFYGKGKPNKNDLGVIEGILRDIDGTEKMKISGNWQSHLEITYIDDYGNEVTETIWKISPLPEHFKDQENRYFISDWGLNLNNDDEKLLKSLPRSDSRLRPDQRELENQNVDFAGKEKNRIEEKQRRARKELETSKKVYKPMYFTECYDDLTGELNYQYSKDYWEDKKNGNLDHFPDIY